MLFSGNWHEGQPISGSCKYPDGHEFIGDFVNSQPHGKGKFINLDKSYFEGFW
jgi:hypothetical protein